MDSNQNGLIDYSEFIAACLQSYNYLKENHLRSAFAYFDQDGSGQISKDELRLCLQSDDFTLSEDQINNLLQGVDANNDGQIDYSEFINMMGESIWVTYSNKQTGFHANPREVSFRIGTRQHSQIEELFIQK